MSDTKRFLGIFALAMINVAAIVSLRNLSIMVEFGASCVVYYVLAAVLFFIPTALVCAELATGWPKSGGVYRWVAEAFGHPVGFMAVWFAWMLSVSWFPAVLTFTASCLAFVINPALIDNKTYMTVVMLVVFWGATFVNFLGMKASSWISSMGVILGTLVPGALIIGLGFFWLGQGMELKVDLSLASAVPDFSIEALIFFTGILLSLAGMEMSAFHAAEAEKPKRNYPISILLSAIIILVVYILGSLSIAFVVSPRDINLFAGLMQAFDEFFKAFGIHGWMPVLAILAAIGSLAGINTWIIGPAKGILACAEYGFLPPWLQKRNKNGIPVATLLFQAVVGSLLTLVFLFMPNVNSAFWIITALTIQFAMLMYLLIFLSGIKLRYSQPEVHRGYKVPGGKLGMWLVAGMGSVTSIGAFAIAFIPPGLFETGSLFFYEGFLVGGLILLTIPPLVFIKIKQPHWHSQAFDE